MPRILVGLEATALAVCVSFSRYINWVLILFHYVKHEIVFDITEIIMLSTNDVFGSHWHFMSENFFFAQVYKFFVNKMFCDLVTKNPQ